MRDGGPTATLGFFSLCTLATFRRRRLAAGASLWALPARQDQEGCFVQLRLIIKLDGG